MLVSVFLSGGETLDVWNCKRQRRVCVSVWGGLLTETAENEGSSRLCWAQSSAGYSGAFWWEKWEIVIPQNLHRFSRLHFGCFGFFCTVTLVITNKNMNDRKEKQVFQSFNLFSGITEIWPSFRKNAELLALGKINSAALLWCSKCSSLCRQIRTSSPL